ncbi:acyl-CoA dehydrogenase family protein, partial [Streptomyces rubellomurinus]
MGQDFDLFRISEEHQMLREAVRSLAEAKIAPYAAEVDEQ